MLRKTSVGVGFLVIDFLVGVMLTLSDRLRSGSSRAVRREVTTRGETIWVEEIIYSVVEWSLEKSL